MDERRIMILKAQNGQLTRANQYLNEVVRSQKKIIIEVDNILGEIQSMCKNVENSGMKIELKIPEIQ